MIPRYRSPVGLRDFANALVNDSGPDKYSQSGVVGGRYVRFLPSASDALHFALRQIGASGNVILPAYTCLKVVRAVQLAGWTPVFIDVDLATGSMLQSGVKRALDGVAGSKVILATHLHGVPNAMCGLVAEAKSAGAILIEDCAMAQGAMHQGSQVGSFGDWAIFSFGLGKVLSIGAGGALTCKQETAMLGADHRGSKAPYFFQVVSRLGPLGWLRFHAQETIKQLVPTLVHNDPNRSNQFQPSELTASAARNLHMLLESQTIKQYLEEQRRRSLDWLEFVNELRSDRIAAFTPLASDVPCYPGLPLIVSDRNDLQVFLRKQGIDSARYFDYCAAQLAGDTGSYPNSEYLAKHSLVLPLYQMSKSASRAIKRALRSYVH